MPQLYIQKNAQPDTWVMSGAPTATTVFLSLDAIINYSDGTSDTLPANTLAVLPDATTVFDRTHDVYVCYTVQTSGVLSAIKESLLPTLSSAYAPLCRIEMHGIKPYQPEPYLSAGSVLTTTTTALVSDAGAKAQAIAAGTDPEAAYPGWTTAGFDDSAWPAAVPVTPNSSDAALVPAGASALWSKASGAPYRVSGAAIGTFSVPVTSSTGGSPAWTLTPGTLYALETVGGPWSDLTALADPRYDDVRFLQGWTSGPVDSAWHSVDTHALDSWETTSDANHFRVYFRATATSLRVGVLDSFWGDNSGSISVTLSPAEEIEVLVRGAVVLPSGPVSSAVLQAAFDSSGDAWVNGTHEAADPGATAAGPLLSVSVAPTLLTPGATTVVAAQGVGPGGSSPDKGWVAFSLAVAASGLAPGAGGTVTSVALAGPTGTSVSGSPVTSSGTLSLAWSSQSGNRVLASPPGSSGAPTFRALVGADIPVDASTIVSSAGTIKGNYQAGAGVSISGNTISATGSGGSVTSVALSAPALFSVAGSPLTSSGTLALSYAAGQTLPTAQGGTGLDGSAAANGALLIGNGAGYTLATLTAGSGVTVTNASGTITIAASGGGGSGTVTSVALSLPGIFSVSGSPVTTSGTLSATLAPENAASVFAGPASGSAAAPTFRALQGSDLPAAAAAGGHIHAHGHFL